MPQAANRPANRNNSTPAPAAAPGSASSNASRGALRTMSYADGRNAVAPGAASPGQTLGVPADSMLTSLFARIDRDRDKGIERSEVITHLKAVGISGGLFGIVHKTIANSFIEELDKNSDGNVTWQEFKSVAAKVMPSDLFDGAGQLRPELVDEVFATIDKSGDGNVDEAELQSSALDKLPADTSHRGTKATVSAKLGMDALDLDKSGGITRAELLKAAAAVSALR